MTNTWPLEPFPQPLFKTNQNNSLLLDEHTTVHSCYTHAVSYSYRYSCKDNFWKRIDGAVVGLPCTIVHPPWKAHQFMPCPFCYPHPPQGFDKPCEINVNPCKLINVCVWGEGVYTCMYVCARLCVCRFTVTWKPKVSKINLAFKFPPPL